MRIPLSWLSLVFLGGCVFDTGGIAPPPGGDLSADAARLDQGGVVDAPWPDRPDTASDLPVADGPLPDTTPFDIAVAEQALDTPSPDLPPLDGPALDLAMPDLPPPDLPSPDLPPPDLPTPDQTFVLGDAMTDAAIAYCAARFGSAPGYILCWVSPSGCAFNVTTNGTCNAMCQSLGSSCVAAWDNPNTSGQECDAYSQESCGTSRGTEICLCSK